MQDHHATARRRRAVARTCPQCHKLWAVRGARLPSGAWAFHCRFCAWRDNRGAVTDVLERSSVKAVHGHGVYFQTGADDLVRALADYLAEGWASGGIGVVIATDEHRVMLDHLLQAWGLSSAASQGRLIELDAERCLSLFMRDGTPDPYPFDQTVGSLVRKHAREQPLRAFGEMVDVLWTHGNDRAALRLEQLWERLQAQIGFPLLCAYTAFHLDADGRDAVCRAHDHIAS